MIPNLNQFLGVTQDDLREEAFLKKKEDVFFLCLNKKGNTFSLSFCRKINELLDIVQANEGNTALVTVSTQKLFSGGLDLNFMMGDRHKMDKSYFVLEVVRLFGRMTVFPAPTFALVNGSAVAAGCMIAFSHDQIYVHDKATFYCNQVEIGLPLPPGMSAVIKRKLLPKDYRDMCIYAKRFSAQQGFQKGFVDGIINQSPLQFVFKIAKEKSKFSGNKAVLKGIKQECNKEVLEACFSRQLDPGVRGQGGFSAKL